MQRLLKVLLMMLALCLLLVGMTLVVLPAKEVGFQEKQHSLRRTNIRKKMLVGGTGKQRLVFEDAEFPRRALRHKEHISPPPPALNACGSFGGFVPSPPSSPPDDCVRLPHLGIHRQTCFFASFSEHLF